MTPERWERVTELFEAVLHCEPHERRAIIGRMCAGDRDLRTEVESLVDEHERTGGFLDAPGRLDAAVLLRDAWQEAADAPAADARLGTTIASRYQIDATLGRGGQALVYRARDLMLMSKPVVVKILSAAAHHGSRGKRMRHEIEALARIDHPGVVGVLDTGSLPDGTPFLVMQYAEGTTLRQTLASGPVERARAAAILRQIGAALEAAHSRGIAHGDLKPENIVLQRLSDGSELVKLIDFGIARVEKADAASTTTGPIAGTVRYMAPEQFEGETSRASDVYALGLLACEMLCGSPDSRALRAPRHVARLIRAALAFQPHERPPSAKAWSERLAGALLHSWRRRLEAAAAIAVVVVAIIWALWHRASVRPDNEAIEIRTLAILPFQMLGPPAADGEAISLGLADGLITRLSTISGLTIRPIATVRQYNAAAIDPVRAARDLQVDAIVEGTLMPSGTGLRANARLIRARDGGAQWAGTIESDGRHLLRLEESIAQQIAANINVQLTEGERRTLDTRRQVIPEAHELYVKGRLEWGRRTRDGFEKAADYFRRAIDLDPTFARAYVGLADCFLLLGGYNYQSQLEMAPKAKALALRALELDPALGEAHATLALTAQNLEWDWERVEAHYRQAIALAPNYATGHHWYAEYLSILGRFDESRREFAQARRIDPISPIIQVDEAQLSMFERQFDRSFALLAQVAGTDPGFEPVHERIAFLHLLQGRDEEAWQHIQRSPACREPASECHRAWTAYLPARNPAAASEALRWMEQEARRRHVAAFSLVLANARQGRRDRALEWLEHMLETHGVSLITLHVNPLFDALRADPRFTKVVASLRMPVRAPLALQKPS